MSNNFPRVEDTGKNTEICAGYCTVCPSFPGKGILFCARGKSSGNVIKKGCLCPSCEVQKDHGCTGTYYCAAGVCD